MVEHTAYFLAAITAGGLFVVRPTYWNGTTRVVGFETLLVTVQGEKVAVIRSLGLLVLARAPGFGWIGLLQATTQYLVCCGTLVTHRWPST